MYEKFSFLVPCSTVCIFFFLPQFSYWILFRFFLLASYTMPLCTICTHGREENRGKNEKKYISDLYRVARTLFYDEHKGMRRNQENQPRGKKNINTYQFFADTRFFLFSYTQLASIRNQNIYQQRNENGMDRWLQINKNNFWTLSVVVVAKSMQLTLINFSRQQFLLNYYCYAALMNLRISL